MLLRTCLLFSRFLWWAGRTSASSPWQAELGWQGPYYWIHALAMLALAILNRCLLAILTWIHSSNIKAQTGCNKIDEALVLSTQCKIGCQALKLLQHSPDKICGLLGPISTELSGLD